MKKEKCFKYSEKAYTMLNYPQRGEISAITNATDLDNIEFINPKINSSFSRQRIELYYLFSFYSKRSVLGEFFHNTVCSGK